MGVCPVLLYAPENEQVTGREYGKQAGDILAYFMQPYVRAGYFYFHKRICGNDRGKCRGHKNDDGGYRNRNDSGNDETVRRGSYGNRNEGKKED